MSGGGYFNGAAVAHQIDYQLHIEHLEAQLRELAGDQQAQWLSTVDKLVRHSGRTRIQSLNAVIRTIPEAQFPKEAL